MNVFCVTLYIHYTAYDKNLLLRQTLLTFPIKISRLLGRPTNVIKFNLNLSLLLLTKL